MTVLSKSSFIRGRQCELSLFLFFNYKKLDIPRDEPDYAKFEAGHNVGKLAQQLFPEGTDTGYTAAKGDYKEAVKNTKKAITKGKKVIYEGAFEHDGCLSIIDIMVLNGNKWDLYEVKSSNNVKDYQEYDAAFQYQVIKNNGLKIGKVYIIHLDGSYERIGELKLNKLFTKHDITAKVKSLQDEITELTKKYKKTIIAEKMPVIPFGKNCNNEPGICDFYSYCWRDIPDYSIFNISHISKKAYALYEKGIIDIKDIPDDFDLSDNQQIEVKSYKEDKPFINTDKITEFLDGFDYPLYFLDFETYSSAVPEFDHTRPWQQIPFQFSIHYRKDKAAKPVHYEFLGRVNGDPRPDLIKELVYHLNGNEKILTFNQSFEKTQINNLARDFPDHYNELKKINDRILDISVPFSKKYFYTSDMQSRWSLKNVLPSLCPELSYDELEIGDGGTASEEFVRCRKLDDKKEIARIRENLLKYCKMDTYALVRILEELEKTVGY